MSKKNNFKYKEDIKNAFNLFEPENNGIIETKQLNSINKLININKKNPYIYNSINELTSKKKEENNEYISPEEYISYFDEQLSDSNSKEGLEKIFNVFSDGNKNYISWTKLPLVAKELGDEEMANNLMKLIEQAKLFNKELNFEEFCEIMGESYEQNVIFPKENDDDLEQKETYKTKKLKKKKKEEEEDIITISSKNEDSKKSIEETEGEISNKRYHRRYRDTKNKRENNDTGNNINNNKTHTKYRKKK